MVQEEKKQIATRLKEYCSQKGSQNKAANSLNGVSSATISKILAGDWETISDEMWRTIAAQTGHDKRGEWNIAETRAYKRMTFLLNSAKSDSLVLAVTGDAGCGKTEAIRTYTQNNRNVYHLCCSEYWNRRVFMSKLLQCMGVDFSGATVSDMMDDIIDNLKKKDTPMVILDEADKLSDQVLYFFISIYNQLEGHCGLILCATNYLEKRIKKGLRSKRKGYEEIYSRLGRKFIELQVINREDVAAVCIANGVTEDEIINAIVADSECDLRRVKRAVWAEQKRAK
ncbi:MAG: ATP-binding protein [Marinilabiliaceae bacterium]|nr:ATP-binding protein [Marinilabiliaceae bacterium]